MAEDITAPLNLRDISIVRTLEAFKQARDGKEVSYLSLDDRSGLTVYAKNHEIFVDDGRLSPGGTRNTKLVEEVLREIGIPPRLINEMRRKSARSKRGYLYLIWMPIKPIPITFMDHLLDRRRREWQLVTTRL